MVPLSTSKEHNVQTVHSSLALLLRTILGRSHIFILVYYISVNALEWLRNSCLQEDSINHQVLNKVAHYTSQQPMAVQNRPQQITPSYNCPKTSTSFFPTSHLVCSAHVEKHSNMQCICLTHTIGRITFGNPSSFIIKYVYLQLMD